MCESLMNCVFPVTSKIGNGDMNDVIVGWCGVRQAIGGFLSCADAVVWAGGGGIVEILLLSMVPPSDHESGCVPYIEDSAS